METSVVARVRSVRGPLAEVVLEAGQHAGVGHRFECHEPKATLLVTAKRSDSELLCVVGEGKLAEGARLTAAKPNWNRELDAVTLGAFAQARASQRSANPDLLETGVKAIDFLCPLHHGGSFALLGGAQSGKMVVLAELLHRLPESAAQTIHLPSSRPLLRPLHELRPALVTEESLPALDVRGDLELLWTVTSAAADPQYAQGLAKEHFDAVAYLCIGRALRGLYPAIEGRYCSSVALSRRWVEKQHLDVHAEYQRLAARAASLTQDSLFWELRAQGASSAAGERYKWVEKEALRTASTEDSLALRRVRLVDYWLTQPFFVAAPFTGMDGTVVSRRETVRTVKAMLEGAFDALEPHALYMKGSAPA